MADQQQPGVNLRALWALREDARLSATAWKVAMALVAFCDEEGRCYPGVRTLAKACRAHPSTVRRGLKELENSKGPVRFAITRDRLSRQGDADSHEYRLSIVEGWAHAIPTVGSCDPHGGAPVRGRVGSCVPPKKTVEEDREGEARPKRKRPSSRRATQDDFDAFEPSKKHIDLASKKGLSLDPLLLKFREKGAGYNYKASGLASAFANWIDGEQLKKAGVGRQPQRGMAAHVQVGSFDDL